MADDLVVREWPNSIYLRWDLAQGEHNALARAYLERDAQLAAMTAERNNWRDLYSKDLIRANEDKDALQAQLTAMTAERDAALAVAERAELNYAPLWDRYCALDDKLTASEAALRKYGRHEQGCPVIFTPELCICGLSAALAETAEKGKSNGV